VRQIVTMNVDSCLYCVVANSPG